MFTQNAITQERFLSEKSDEEEGILTSAEIKDRILMTNIESNKASFEVIGKLQGMQKAHVGRRKKEGEREAKHWWM